MYIYRFIILIISCKHIAAKFLKILLYHLYTFYISKTVKKSGVKIYAFAIVFAARTNYITYLMSYLFLFVKFISLLITILLILCRVITCRNRSLKESITYILYRVTHICNVLALCAIRRYGLVDLIYLREQRGKELLQCTPQALIFGLESLYLCYRVLACKKALTSLGNHCKQQASVSSPTENTSTKHKSLVEPLSYYEYLISPS